jgi:soluble lytic murein transglycosylase-like protein
MVAGSVSAGVARVFARRWVAKHVLVCLWFVCVCFVSGLLGPGVAWAGTQQYEPLSDAVRLALQAALHDRTPPEPLFNSQAERERWMSEMHARLRKKLDDPILREDLLKTARYEAQRAGLDPQLVLALIEVESGFRQYAISHVGARGLMQVMPFWTRVIGDGNPSTLFNMRSNIRYGCVILRHYLDIEKGNVSRALGRYNGSLGKSEYPNLVLGALNSKWAW